MTKRPVWLPTLLIALAGTGGVSAQLISIKTVPIAQGDQFQIFPSNNFGMGGVSIALPDTLLDPFVNPAKGARLGAARFLSAPTLYSLSHDAGGGRTLPLAVIGGSGSWYGGVSLALQEVDASRPATTGLQPPGRFLAGVDTAAPPSLQDLVGPAEQSHGNQYAFAMLGKVVPGTRLSLGGSVSWARLTALDGVDLLFAGSERVKQFGHALDVRLGVLKEWAGDRSLEALVLHDRFGMTYDVGYLDRFWNPGTQQIELRPRLENNRDHTNTWGLHVEYARPLTSSGWRIGWLATANRMSHPKLPEYELANVPVIPRDPGHSSAYNVGIGLSKTRGGATFGIDAIYEPIWSYTWADAAGPVATLLGDTIPAGGKTVENHFRFSNGLLRMGFGQEVQISGSSTSAGLQLGLVARSIHYWLRQFDNVQLAGRKLEEAWLEWTPTWGLSLRFPELEIRYRGRVAKGTGRPGVQQPIGVFETRGLALASGSILVAPSGPLSLTEVSQVTHQISLSLPLH